MAARQILFHSNRYIVAISTNLGTSLKIDSQIKTLLVL